MRPTAKAASPQAGLMVHLSPSSEHEKATLRQALLAARPTITPRQNRQLVARLLRVIHHARPSVIGAVWPLPGEADLRPLCRQLLRAGYQLALPQTPRKGQPLIFRQWCETTPMRKGRFGTSFPKGAHRRPDLILVPLVSFDRQGGRLGYGGGYYDRTLPLHPDARLIGYGFSSQEAGHIPMGEHDHRLPVIVTEREVIQTERDEG